MQHTNLSLHVTCHVIIIEQFKWYDLTWTFCFARVITRLLLGVSWSLVYWLVPALHVYVYQCSRHHFLCMFFDSDLSMHMYLLDLGFTIDSLIFIYVTGHYLYLYTWTTLFHYVHEWLPEHANWLYLTYSMGCFLTTLDPHIQIQEPGPWWPCYSWSECAAEAWISCYLSGPSFLLAPLIGSRDSHLATRECFPVFLYCISCLFAFWWSNILRILYLALW